MSAATPKGPCEGDLCERKLWAPGVGCQGWRASPAIAATGVQAAQSVTHLQPHGACSSESDTANYVQSSAARVSFVLFFFLFCSPSKPKAFCTPQASTFTCFTPINAIKKSSRAPCAWAVPGSRVAAGLWLDSPGRRGIRLPQGQAWARG